MPGEGVATKLTELCEESGVCPPVVGLTIEDIERIAKRTAEEVMDRIREGEHDRLMLHSIPYAYGSPGIIVDETKAEKTPCKCVEYKPGKSLCWSPGIWGALTNEQEKLYCPTTEKIERPGTIERMSKWQDAVNICKTEIAAIPESEGEKRVTTWLRCMSRELVARGIEA